MALDIRDVEDFLRLLRENPELRDAARRELVDEDLRALPLIVRRLSEAQERTEAKLESLTSKVQELAEAQRNTEAKLGELALRVEQLVEAQKRTEARFNDMDAKLDATFKRIEGRLSNLEGWRYQSQFNVMSHLWDIVRKPVQLGVFDIEEVVAAKDAGKLTADDWRHLKALDAIYLARQGRGADAPQVYVTVEVSRVVDKRDVGRAADRAAILRRCGVAALAAAGGSQVTAGARTLASERNVHLLIDRPNDTAPDADDDD